MVGLVQTLRAAEPVYVGVLFGIFFGVWLFRQAVAVADQEVLEVGARVGVERIQHLVQLHGIGSLRDRQRRSRGQSRGGRAARLQVHEPVAFQEDARTDLRGRVRVDRQPAPFEFHAHERDIALALDRGDLAHVHARDAHGRLAFDVERRSEHRVQPVAVFERNVLREAEVERDPQQDQEQDREAHGVGPAQLDDRDFVVAAPQATAGAAHLPPPFPFALRRLLALVGWCASPRSLSVEAGYFSPYKFCSRVVSSRLVLTLAGGRLPTTALPFS